MRPIRALGIDGGSSRIRALRLAPGEAEQRVERIGGTNLHATPAAEVLARLAEVAAALGPVDAVCIGSAGIDAPGDREQFTKVFAEVFPRVRLLVCSDVELLPACDDAPAGIGLIVGTGSNCFAWWPGGSAAWGGLDLPLSDWGSAARMGEAAMVEALRQATGIHPVTTLGPAIFAALGLAWPGEWRGLKPARAALDKAALGALAARLAALPDPAAERIQDEAADETVAVLRAARARLPEGPILAVGGVLQNARIRARIEAAVGPLRLVDPVRGAARLAAAL